MWGQMSILEKRDRKTALKGSSSGPQSDANTSSPKEADRPTTTPTTLQLVQGGLASQSPLSHPGCPAGNPANWVRGDLIVFPGLMEL